MKKLSILLLTTILSSSVVFAQDNRSLKRGFAEETLVYEEDYNQLKKGSTWFYDWAISPSAQLADLCGAENGLEFVPMVWGSGFNADQLKAWSEAHPNDRFILGFNEPNLTGNHGGSAINPTKAAEVWHELEQFAKDNNLKLVAPALNYSPDEVDGVRYSTPDMWMDAWINAYKSAYGTAPQYEYLALHSYMGNATAMKSYIDNFAKKYGKKVWLTEFASAPDGITETEESQVRKMIEMVMMLEKNDNVYRYAWFKGRDANIAAPFWGLITKPNKSKGIERGHLSTLGYTYNNMPVYTGEDKYFAIGESFNASKFADCSNLMGMRQSKDKLFYYGPELIMMGGSASVTYNIDVPADGDYKLVMRYANNGNTVKMNIIDKDGNKQVEKFELPSTGGESKYSDISFDISLKAGKQPITISKANFADFGLTRLEVNTTGTLAIDNVKAAKNGNKDAWYTLQGVRVAEPTTKGIYIHQGRKVIVR